MSTYNFTSPASAQFTSDSGKPDKLVTTVSLQLEEKISWAIESMYDLTEEMFLVRAKK